MENIYSCVGDLVYGFCESARFRMRLNFDVLYIQTNPGTYLEFVNMILRPSARSTLDSSPSVQP